MASPVVVYPGELLWASDVSCNKTPNRRHIPKPELPAPFNSKQYVPICFLNESRTRYGRYEIPKHSMDRYHDDGPASLDQIVEACRIIDDALKSKRQVVVYTPKDPEFASHRGFSVLCTAAHGILAKNLSAEEAVKPWQTSEDGSSGVRFFVHSLASKKFPAPARTLTMEHCLEAIQAARDHGWLSLATFDTRAYINSLRKYDTVWLVPGEVQVLSDPMSDSNGSPEEAAATFGVRNSVISQESSENFGQKLSFTDSLKQDNVKLVVRLNYTSEEGLEHSYDPKLVEQQGISLMDSPYPVQKGSVPRPSMLARVLTRCEKIANRGDGSIAFQGKEGFGRSVTVASTWLAYHYDLPGSTALAWCRLCRPGSITSFYQARYLMDLKGKQELEKMIHSAGCCSVQ